MSHPGGYRDGLIPVMSDRKRLLRRARREVSEATIGANLRRMRQALQMTQQQVADAAGVPRTYISRTEHSFLTPRSRMLSRLAEALGCEPGDLLTPYTAEIVHWFGCLNEDQKEHVIERVSTMIAKAA